jgi:hypothetical protein
MPEPFEFTLRTDITLIHGYFLLVTTCVAVYVVMDMRKIPRSTIKYIYVDQDSMKDRKYYEFLRVLLLTQFLPRSDFNFRNCRVERFSLLEIAILFFYNI